MAEIEIVVPQVGEAVAEVILREWLVQEGAVVHRGEPLFQVDTDKAVVEVEAIADGVLTKILAPADSAVMPRQVVALLTPVGAEGVSTDDGRRMTEDRRSLTVDASPVAAKLAAELKVDLAGIVGTGPGGRIMTTDVQAAAAQSATSAPATEGANRIFAAPKAKRLAQELGVDLGRVTGTGREGMITAEDVEATATTRLPTSLLSREGHAAQPSFAGKGGEGMGVVEPHSRLRQAIAERMVTAKQQVPHFYLMADVEMTQAQRLRAYLQEAQPATRPPTYTDMIVRAAALAFRARPQLNVVFAKGGLVRRTAIDIGVAVSLADGLIVPVLRAADQRSLLEISQAQREATERARSGRLRPDDLGDKSLTLSNLGMHGVDAFVAILDQPAPMILAVGRAADRAIVVEKQVVVRSLCTFTLSVDHRVLDGVQAADFLMLIKAHIENPFGLLGEKP